MDVNSIIQQGTFQQAATPVDHNLVLRSDVDWITVLNYTQSIATNADYGCHYYWQRGMTDGLGLVYYHPAPDETLAVQSCAAGAGFSLVDSSNTDPLASRAITATTNAAQPVVSAANTSGLQEGSIVRLQNVTGAVTLGGWDFEIDTITAGVSFRMRYAMATAPGAAGTAGTYRHVPYDPIFYPRWRYIVNITAANPAVITTSVRHGYTVGQKIRVNLPDLRFGMTQINGMEAIVTAVTASTITTNIDASAFTAFTFALPALYPVGFPSVNPIGMDMGTAITGAVDLLADARYNTAYIGMKLHVGDIAAPNRGSLSPAGSNATGVAGAGDVMYWRAGKSFSNLIE